MGDKRTVDDLIESWDAADNQAGKPVSEEITDSDVSILSNAMAYALLGNSKRAVEMINKGSKTMSYGEALARMGIDDPSSTSATEMWKKISKPIAAAIKKIVKSISEDVSEEGAVLDEEITSDIERIMAKLGEALKDGCFVGQKVPTKSGEAKRRLGPASGFFNGVANYAEMIEGKLGSVPEDQAEEVIKTLQKAIDRIKFSLK